MAERSLNTQQHAAVTTIKDPLLIVAGAGTGKTTVVAHKIAYLIDVCKVSPEHILALTFTEKAAHEMEERVSTTVNIGYSDLTISTFHSFAERLISQYGLTIGIPNQARLLTTTDAWMLMRDHLYDFDLDFYRPLGSPSRHIHALLNHFSACKDALISPAAYLEYVENTLLDHDAVQQEEKTKYTELANAYHTYQQLLLDNNAMDFGDLMYYSVQILRDRPSVRAQLQTQYKYIIVDEFQDVNWAQYELVRLLAENAEQLTVVGDDDQSIYAFRGASVSNILRFKDDFPSAKEVVLTENYRSGQDILDIAYKSIQYNNPDRLEVKLNLNKKLRAAGGHTGAVTHFHALTQEEEVAYVVNQIENLIKENEDLALDEIAILVRANNHAAPFIHALESARIPHEFFAASGLFMQPLVLDCLNFFELLVHRNNSPATYRLLRLPSIDVPARDIQVVTAFANKKSISFMSVIEFIDEVAGISESGKIEIKKLLTVIHASIDRAKTEKPSIVLYMFLDEIGYLRYLAEEELQGNEVITRQIYQLKQFFELIESYEQITPDMTVMSFLERIEHMRASGDAGEIYQPQDTPDSVNILTVHGSKGLEFDHVFVVNLVEGRFPGYARGGDIEVPRALIHETLPEGDYHYEEERRLFYVAATRARKSLHLCSADFYGGVRKKKISRFLDELGYSTQENTKKDNQKKKVAFITKHNSTPLRDESVYQLPKAYSFSQLTAYQACPYKYKLRHVLKIPTKGSAAFSFGQTMHSTLQKFYEQLTILNSATQISLFDTLPSATPDVTAKKIKVPTFKELLAFYEKSWIGDWYENKTQKKEYYTQGKQILKLFYTAQQDNWVVPYGIEKWFKIKVGDYTVHGRMDRIDQLPDQSFEIVDYKTGKSKEMVTGDDKDQLLIYQIAAQTIPEFTRVGTVEKLTFYYLNDGIKTSFLGKDKEIEKLKDKLVHTIDNIAARDFTATPSAFVCEYCEYKNMCEFREG